MPSKTKPSTNLSAPLRHWYKQFARTLPWRETKDPYSIWLSEIILQQTRVNQGLPYYQRFLEAFPKVEDLAMAHEDNVLKLWEGLGYYSRARNLHRGAKFIADNGFPSSYSEWLEVPGVGPYTAAAVSSFVLNEERAVIDGNVYRVLSRLMDVRLDIGSSEGKKAIEAIAATLIEDQPPAEHNQAIMELGALVCTPKNPKCEECPWNNHCLALEKKTIFERPVKRRKTKVKSESIWYTALVTPNGIWVRKRDTTSIWKGLFELAPVRASELELPINSETELTTHTLTHLLSHRKLEITIQTVHLQYDSHLKVASNLALQHCTWAELERLAFPRPIRHWLDDILLPL